MPPSTPTQRESVVEAWRWLAAALGGQPVPPLLIVIGLGDGSLLDALDERAPATRVLALEPDPAAARVFFAKRRDSAWRTSGRLVYLADPGYAGADEAWRIFKQKDEPRVLMHPSAQKAPGTARATEALTKILSGVKANAQARRRFAPRYLTNVIRNIPAIASGGDVRSLTNVYRGVPAIVAAAGPSLDNAVPDLQRITDRALLIACDTALRPLLHAGIAPALVVGADPSTANARHFQSLPECPATHLVAESALDPSAAAVFHGRTLWFRLAPHHPWPWLNTVGIEVGLVEMWGSVLTAAFQVACLAGCDPIVIVGADLAHTGGRPYARTTTYELDWAHAVARGETLDQTWRGQIAGSRPIERPDLRGVVSTTTPTMLAFRDWMVARAKRSGRRVINATGAGMLFGDGIEQGTLDAALRGTREIPAVPKAVREDAIDRSLVAEHLRAVRRMVGSSSTPVADWISFTEGGLDEATLAAALGDTIGDLESPRSLQAHPKVDVLPTLFGIDEGPAGWGRLAELIERLKAGLNGAAPEPRRRDSGTLLVRALALLARIGDEVRRGKELEPVDSPPRDAVTPASVGYAWPEATRWPVLTFEALIGAAWQGAAASADVPFFALPLTPRDTGSAESPGLSAGARRPVAAHACLLLAAEWLRAAGSLEPVDAPRLNGIAERLSKIGALILRESQNEALCGTVALEITATSQSDSAELHLPLGLSAPALARALTGVIGHRSALPLFVDVETPQIAVTVSLAESAAPPGIIGPRRSAPTTVAVRPQVLTDRCPNGQATVAYATSAGVVCVSPFGHESVLVREDGSHQPHLHWPFPINGELPLGVSGAIAWSPPLQEINRYHVMYRASAKSNVVVQTLPFRPSERAVMWQDRMYWTLVPNGIGSWSPAEAPAVHLDDLSILLLEPTDTHLVMVPRVRDAAGVIQRRLLREGLGWKGEGTVEAVALGASGIASHQASSKEWTAVAHPEADVIRLRSRKGVELTMVCYSPLRVAWCGRSLFVSTVACELLIFEGLAELLASFD